MFRRSSWVKFHQAVVFRIGMSAAMVAPDRPSGACFKVSSCSSRRSTYRMLLMTPDNVHWDSSGEDSSPRPVQGDVLPQVERIAMCRICRLLDPSTQYAIPISKTLWSHSSAYAPADEFTSSSALPLVRHL